MRTAASDNLWPGYVAAMASLLLGLQGDAGQPSSSQQDPSPSATGLGPAKVDTLGISNFSSPDQTITLRDVAGLDMTLDQLLAQRVVLL